MKCNGLAWVGVRTAKFQELCDFYEQLLGLSPVHSEPGFRAYDLTDRQRVEVFAEDYEGYDHFSTGPVVGFLVDDIETARAEMESRGVKFLSPIDGTKGDSRWSHFRGPDGNVYEITERANPLSTV